MGIGKKWNEYVHQTRMQQLLHRGMPYVKKNMAVDFCKFVDAELRDGSNLPDRVVMALKMLHNGDSRLIYGMPTSLVIAKKYWNGEVKEYER